MFSARMKRRATFVFCGALASFSVVLFERNNKRFPFLLLSEGIRTQEQPEMKLAANDSDKSLAGREVTVNNTKISFNSPNITELDVINVAKNYSSLIPLQKFREYVEQHSDRRLMLELHACLKDNKFEEASSCLSHRKFLLADYSCPFQAGNRIHWFLNNMLWAVLTNRTVLWRYLDTETCSHISNNSGPIVNQAQECCITANEKSDCDAVLTLAQWVPSFHKWNATLNFGSAMPVLQNFTSLDDSPKLIQAGSYNNPKHSFHFGNALKTDHKKHQLWQSLFKFQRYFLYGMLFENTFAFTERIIPERSTVADHRLTRTVAVHVRHPNQNDRGGNIRREKQCLERYLKNHEGPCAVYILSDRSLTIELLSNATQSLNCTPISVSHTTETYGYRQEHGPYAGEAFFRDLALAANARSGFVVSVFQHGRRIPLRSSSALLLELIEYRTRLEGANESIPMCT